MYYRYAVTRSGELKEDRFARKQRALEYAQPITIEKHEATRVYRQRYHADTGQCDIVLLVEYWWDGVHLQFQERGGENADV